MSEQEKIREGIANIELVGNIREGRLYLDLIDVINIFKNLHSQGLEIVKYPKQGDDLTSTHIVWSEPLIKEDEG